MSNVQLGYTQVIDPISFKSIPSGKIYIGEYGTLPNPANAGTWKQAYFVNSDGTRIAASQPIATNAAGYAVDGSGNIKSVQVDGQYSILVQSSIGVTKFSIAKVAPLVSAEQVDIGSSRTQADKNAEIVSVKDYGAKGDGTTDDTVAINLALDTGKSVFFPSGNYRISAMLYPRAHYQIIYGAGMWATRIFNDINDAPLFTFGDITSVTGAKEFCGIHDLYLEGRDGGSTTWGIFAPTLATKQSGQYEGVSSDSANFYNGRYPATPAVWSAASRGCWIENVAIRYVLGGFGLHVSAWGFSAKNVVIWTGAGGVRLSGDANSNSFSDLYISSHSAAGIVLPDQPSSIPLNCSFDNVIVQQCGKTSVAAIDVLKGQSTYFYNLYLERNNERASTDTDVFVGSAAVGTTLQGIRHRVDSGFTDPIVVRTEGTGTTIDNVVYTSQVARVVHITGSNSATETYVGNIQASGGTTTVGETIDDSTNKKTVYYKQVGKGLPVALGWWTNSATSLATSLKIKQGRSTGHTLDMVSAGSVKIIADSGNTGTGRSIKFGHNGEDGTETTLLQINDTGHVTPGADNTQNLGAPSARMAVLYAGTGTINTSDGREKTSPMPIDDVVLDAWGDVQLITFKWLEMVAQKGGDARWHFGVIAQQVHEAFSAHGLDGTRYGLLCYDEWEDQYEPVMALRDNPETGEQEEYDTGEVQLVQAAGNRWGIRPDQCLFLEAAYQRRRCDRIEQRLTELENK